MGKEVLHFDLLRLYHCRMMNMILIEMQHQTEKNIQGEVSGLDIVPFVIETCEKMLFLLCFFNDGTVAK